MEEIDRMTCEEAFRRLDSYLDRELTPREIELVEQHLEVCKGCARAFDFEANVIEEVRGKLQRISAPQDLMSRISHTLATIPDKPSDS